MLPQEYISPEFEVLRDPCRCIQCRACERQCANLVHRYDAEENRMYSDSADCVDCQRCVCICPTHALQIVENRNQYRPNTNWSMQTMKELYRQAGSGGALLSSMGNPKPYPIYWDHLLINASQVTNPSIDPLREPMETRVYLGKREVPVERDHTIVQVASGRFGVHERYLDAGAAIEIKMGQGAKPGIGGHLPGEKVGEDVSRTRMIPLGTDAISPAPHHDIYSIEDLRQLIDSLKEATDYKKPVIVKVAAVHNVAAIASGIARSGADIIAIDGFRGGTGAAPTMIRDHVGIPIELALAAVDARLREEGIRNCVSLIAGGSIRCSADVVKAIALGADAVYLGTAALMALGCHLCRSCSRNKCNWGIATRRPDLVKRLNPEVGEERLVNLVTGWTREIKEILGGMGINSIEALRGNRLMLRGIGLSEKELEILGVKHAGE